MIPLWPEVTVKFTPLLATPPAVTTTLPVVAPLGTGAAMLVAVQLVGLAAVPLNVTVPGAPPKFVPLIVTVVPTGPDVGFRLLMAGAVEVTVNGDPLLATVSGTGCMSTAITGAFAAARPAEPLAAAAEALVAFGIAGEDAATQARGPGTFHAALYDALYGLDPEMLDRRARVRA